MAMSGFICHDNYYDRLKRLTNEEVGSLFRALMLYHAGREEEIEPFVDSEGIAFDFIRDDIDRMESKNETNRLNGMKGGRPKKEPEETEENPTKPEETEAKPTKGYKDKDKDKDIYKEKDKERDRRFTPPSLEEVTEYCRERNNGIDAQHFIDFYKSKGWKVGNQKMKDWKACIRTWEQRDKDKAKALPANQFPQRNYASVQDEMLEDLAREMEEFQEKGAG